MSQPFFALSIAALVTALVTSALIAQAPTVAFATVTVIPMDRGRALADHTVVVRGDRIEAVGPKARALR
jgi:hypothetical protein